MVGKKIQKRRIELGMTQEELAKKCGYTSKSTISKIELDRNDVSQSKLKKIADALECDPTDLMETAPIDIVLNPDDESKHVIIEYMEKLSRLPQESIESVLQYIDFLSHKKGENDGNN